MDVPFYHQRWFRIGAPVAVVLIVYALLHWRQPAETLAGWIVDALGAGMTFLGALALASQFILPVSGAEDRLKAVGRIFDYVIGQHGPIVFVRGGELVGSAEELKRRGAGVILVDAASAVVLEKGRLFSRALGPGIQFMERQERIATTLDLRRQVRSQHAQALTRDGIQIKAKVSVVFALDPGDQPSLRDSADELDFLGRPKGKPAFPFNPDTAFKAYYGEAVAEKDALKWSDLPAIVAAEHFRDQAGRFTLDELFELGAPDAAPLATLQKRLRLDVQSAALLKSRGIKVYSVSVSGLELPEDVMRQRVRTWAIRWQQKILNESGRADFEVKLIKDQAEAEAKAEILGKFKDSLALLVSGGDGAADRESIAQKLLGELDRVAADPVTSMLLSDDTIRYMADVRRRKWAGLAAEAGGESDDWRKAKIIGSDPQPAGARQPDKPGGASG